MERTPRDLLASPCPGHGRPSLDADTHAVAVVSSPGQVVATAVPFLEDGLRQGDLTVLAGRPEESDELCRHLGEAAGRVEREPRLCLVGGRAPDAFAVGRQLLRRAAGRGSGRVRILALVHRGERFAEEREGERYEAAANAVFAAAPLTALCVYDRQSVRESVIASALATHPEVMVDGVARANPAYREPRALLSDRSVPREAIEFQEPVLVLDDVASLPALRRAIGATLERWVPDPDLRQDLHLAVSEVAANAFRHGSRPVGARVWAGADRIVCTVSDGGRGFADPLAGFVPAHGDDLGRGGMGLWLARKLCDSVDLMAGAAGLTVRLATSLR